VTLTAKDNTSLIKEYRYEIELRQDRTFHIKTLALSGDVDRSLTVQPEGDGYRVITHPVSWQPEPQDGGSVLPPEAPKSSFSSNYANIMAGVIGSGWREPWYLAPDLCFKQSIDLKGTVKVLRLNGDKASIEKRGCRAIASLIEPSIYSVTWDRDKFTTVRQAEKISWKYDNGEEQQWLLPAA
jgi:hypothetical protein